MSSVFWPCAGRIFFVALVIFGGFFPSRGDDGVERDAGLALGKVAPGFSLPDQRGREVSLESLLKNGPVVIVFHRSVDWCLYCKLQMVQLQRIEKKIEGEGGQVVAISYDSAEKLKGYAKRSKITFPLLSDVGSKTIDAFDVRYPDASPELSGFARHATFIVDRTGIIRTKLFRLSYQEKPAVDALINAVKEAGKPKGVSTHETTPAEAVRRDTDRLRSVGKPAS